MRVRDNYDYDKVHRYSLGMSLVNLGIIQDMNVILCGERKSLPSGAHFYTYSPQMTTK